MAEKRFTFAATLRGNNELIKRDSRRTNRIYLFFLICPREMKSVDDIANDLLLLLYHSCLPEIKTKLLRVEARVFDIVLLLLLYYLSAVYRLIYTAVAP